MPNDPRVAVLVVSFNTRDMTLACLRTIREGASRTGHEVVVVDNASGDGSAAAIAREFPEFRLIASEENLGFARANNLAAAHATAERLLLLNPDTLVDPGAIDELVGFADRNPRAGIWGGRTRFADGSPNPTSCWRRPTPWSVFCSATALAGVFGGSRLLNPESVGVLPDGAEIPVDVVTGCWLLIDRELWERLDGFDPAFFMYGEDADLCLRARALGARPRVTARATIVHHGGQSDTVRPDKIVRLSRARRQLYARHWGKSWQWWADIGPMMNVQRRRAVARLRGLLGRGKPGKDPRTFDQVWARRKEWTGARALGERVS
ncbi:MAG: glycosyltransferase family 2 protein [Phycisphaerales bacterium JB060]